MREHAGQGVVEQVTTVHHAAGAGKISVSLASVRLDAGPVLVARLDGRLGPGDRVELVADGGAPVARPHGAGDAERN